MDSTLGGGPIVRQTAIAVLTILLLAEIPTETSSCKYSSITPDHTMCKFSGVGCKLLARGVTSDDIDVILRKQNSIRQTVAAGKGRNHQPPAANMERLAWDEELASVAQRLADQCKSGSDCTKCREVERFPVGQNIRRRRRSLQKSRTATLKVEWDNTMDSWYETVDNFNKASIPSYTHTNGYSTYTQMVWADSSLVGCGFSSYLEGDWEVQFYVCNYGPAGNFHNEEMYKIGPSCSACPKGTKCSGKYAGLCEKNS